jgi:hypothetical protein
MHCLMSITEVWNYDKAHANSPGECQIFRLKPRQQLVASARLLFMNAKRPDVFHRSVGNEKAKLFFLAS